MKQKVTKISEEYPCTEKFTYQYPTTGTFTMTTQTTSFDSKSVKEETTVSLWDGTKRSHKDHANIETTFQ
ncbi:hypothetical protein BDV29DRAFT_167916 [Aspergillus leporis]|jgi:hypothetical protein|uniref:Uncharacterized protein n=1 Tax=Aspergillus leporis TaxID=41062 RepID=A0A5N5XF12_9EURO|nr:hypothetical protein BDV29DRAFT_167916 [Aspergillus leporis]